MSGSALHASEPKPPHRGPRKPDACRGRDIMLVRHAHRKSPLSLDRRCHLLARLHHDFALSNPFTTPASARTRIASLAPEASRSSSPASFFSAAVRLEPLIPSALLSALSIAVVRVSGSPLSRTSWSTYARATGNAAGHTSFGWLCGLS